MINYIRAYAFHNVSSAVKLAEKTKSKQHISFAKNILHIKNSAAISLNQKYDKFQNLNKRLNAITSINFSPDDSQHFDYYKSVHMEEFITHSGESQFRNLGYVSNFMGTNNPGLVIHGNRKGNIYIYNGLERNSDIHNNKFLGQFMSLPDFIDFLIKKHHLNELKTNKKPLHFISCYSGKAQNDQKQSMAQNLANILERSIISYGGHETLCGIEQDHVLQEMLDNVGFIATNQDGKAVKAKTQFLIPESKAPKTLSTKTR
ncbi:hypothetical protein M2263_001457 [Providencia alcalifaciens]|nr:hypothetical protein [Providencia alcalifaciens]